MVVLRCTKKLLGRIKPSEWRETNPPKSTTRLGDWTANLLIIRRQHLVLAVSNITLLPVLVPIAPAKTLRARLPVAVGEMVRALGIDHAKVASELEAMDACFVAATNSRQVLGSMNDFAFALEFAYLDGRPLVDVALHLAETPCGPLDMESPRAATLALFGRPVLSLVRG